MPVHPLDIHLVTQRLDGDLSVAEPLLFPAVAVCHPKPDKLESLVRKLVAEAAGALSPMDWHRHVLAGPPAVGTLRLTVDPPRKQKAWSEPLECAFDYVWWPHAGTRTIPDDAAGAAVPTGTPPAAGEVASAVVAYFPALQIEVIARSLPDLLAVAPEHVRGALRRSTAAESLYRVALLRRVEETTLSTAELVVDLPTPRRRHADAAAERDKKQKPIIAQVGRALSDEPALEPAYELGDAVARVAEALAGRSPRGVLLVGPAGVGKSALVRELVRRRDELGLAGRPIWSTGGARLVAGMTGFGMWQERCAKLCREAAAAQAVVHLGNLVELMEVGQGEMVGQGIASFLKPYLVRGDLLAVAECTPEQLTLVERRDPHLLDALQTVRLEEPTAEVGRRIFAARADALGKGRVRLDAAALAALDRLHRRYAGYSAFPGRPLMFLQNLFFDAFGRLPPVVADAPVKEHSKGRDRGGATAEPEPPPPLVLTSADVTTAFARQSGLPPFLLDDAVPLDLPGARGAFAGRVIGQPDAVELVADLIATVKAGLSRPRRPIASLLFIGPTGVGKTEMAKALAEFFFASADRMTRFDMSEYGSPADVQRLVGGVAGSAVLGSGDCGPGGSASEGLLTAKVREQPFSVVLLDEVEKAHPLLFDLLLQVLGEGRLTDAAGRIADFTNAVVVMTSNLGAESFQRGGFGLKVGGDAAARATDDARAHFTDEVRAFLRPELFNRIDRIVPFLPLDEATVERIVRRELDLVARRDGILLRGVAFAPGDAVVRHLATAGYDRTYGARPLKRLIERELVVPLADGINGYADGTAGRAAGGTGYAAGQRLAADVGVADGKLTVVVLAVVDRVESGSEAGGGGDASSSAGGGRWADVAERAAALRRTVQRLNRSTALVAVANELYLLRRAEQLALARASKAGDPPPYDAVRAKRIGRLAAVADAAAQTTADVVAAEDAALEQVYGGRGATSAPGGTGLGTPRPVPPGQTVAERSVTAAAAWNQLVGFEARLDELLLDLYDIRHPSPDRVTMGLFGRGELAAELARAYVSVAGPEAVAEGWWLRRSERVDSGKEAAKGAVRRPAGRPPKLTEVLRSPPDDAFGLLLTVRARHAVARFTGETGLHVFQASDQQEPVAAYVTSGGPEEFVIPDEVLQNTVSPLRKRRTYLRDRAVAKDERMTRELRWAAGGLPDAVAQGMASATRKLVATVLEEEEAKEEG